MADVAVGWGGSGLFLAGGAGGVGTNRERRAAAGEIRVHGRRTLAYDITRRQRYTILLYFNNKK